MSAPKPGVKVPMGEHSLTFKSANTEGYEYVCSCGFKSARRWATWLHPSVADKELASDHGQHVSHMALVHDVQTHDDRNCGRSCIYPRVKAETGRAAGGQP